MIDTTWSGALAPVGAARLRAPEAFTTALQGSGLPFSGSEFGALRQSPPVDGTRVPTAAPQAVAPQHVAPQHVAPQHVHNYTSHGIPPSGRPSS